MSKEISSVMTPEEFHRRNPRQEIQARSKAFSSWLELGGVKQKDHWGSEGVKFRARFYKECLVGFYHAREKLKPEAFGYCDDCNVLFSTPVLQFHHRYRKDPKYRSVGDLGKFYKLIEEERVVMLCANCHSLRHSVFVSELKEKFVYLLGGVCEECGCSDSRVFEFHHRNPEDKWSSSGFSGYRENPERFERDIEDRRIALFCKNCHRLHHFDQAKSLPRKGRDG